jgi:hypothetical protein
MQRIKKFFIDYRNVSRRSDEHEKAFDKTLLPREYFVFCKIPRLVMQAILVGVLAAVLVYGIIIVATTTVVTSYVLGWITITGMTVLVMAVVFNAIDAWSDDGPNAVVDDEIDEAE